jgi:hypothetical protein
LPVPGLQNAASLGVFTGISGGNVAALPRSFTSVGGDTQMLANFEYRIPIISDMVSLAAFADIGTLFNLRSKSDQRSRANFLADQPFLDGGFLPCPQISMPVTCKSALSSLAVCNNPLWRPPGFPELWSRATIAL